MLLKTCWTCRISLISRTFRLIRILKWTRTKSTTSSNTNTILSAQRWDFATVANLWAKSSTRVCYRTKLTLKRFTKWSRNTLIKAQTSFLMLSRILCNSNHYTNQMNNSRRSNWRKAIRKTMVKTFLIPRMRPRMTPRRSLKRRRSLIRRRRSNDSRERKGNRKMLRTRSCLIWLANMITTWASQMSNTYSKSKIEKRWLERSRPRFRKEIRSSSSCLTLNMRFKPSRMLPIMRLTCSLDIRSTQPAMNNMNTWPIHNVIWKTKETNSVWSTEI